MSTRKELQNIFSKLADVTEAQPQYFEAMCGEDRRIILYGAGGVGKKLARCMYGEYGKRLFFTDQRKELYGLHVEGVPVLGLDEAASLYGESGLFVVTVFNREPTCAYVDIAEMLRQKGVKHYVPWAFPAWKYGNRLLPQFYLGCVQDIAPNVGLIQQAFDLLTDEKSRSIFLELLQASLTAPFDKFRGWESGPQYLVPEILAALPPQISFADCGAYDGDTLRDVLEHLGPHRIKEYHAFEPDATNIRQLEAFVETLPVDLQARIFCHHAAVGDENGFVSIAQEGSESTHVSGKSTASEGVQCVTLDSVFFDKSCDFIKMDIEGFEKEALSGATASIEKFKPILAISAYHRPDDFFALPLLIKSMREGTGFFRKHCANLVDTVYYHLS